MTVMVLFAIGFSASDEDGSSSSNDSTKTQIEQKQETKSNNQETEKQEKIKNVADIAYKKGYEMRMSTRELINAESSAYMEYTMRYGKEPEEEQNKERWNIFKKNYEKGFADAAAKIMKEINSEDF